MACDPDTSSEIVSSESYARGAIPNEEEEEEEEEEEFIQNRTRAT